MMTTYKQYFKSLAAVLPVALTALAAASCSNDDAGSAPTGKTIAFTVTEDSQWQTRGAIAAQSRSLSLQAPGMAQPLYMTTTVADGMAQRTRTAAAEPSWPATRGVKVTTADQLTAFGVSAFLQKKADVSVNTTPGYFYNLKATKNAADQYTVTQNYFWPAADECLHFYAYYPYDDSNVVISAADQAGPQTIGFTVDTDVSKQVDLMTAVAVDEVTSTSVSQPTVTLPFRHELCAVSFRIADQFPDWGSIVSVALKNVYGAGTVTPQQDAAGTWSFTGQNKTTFTAVINKSGTANLNNGKLIDDALTFLMIPQELTDDAVIELVYQDNRQNYTLTASLKEALKITDSEDPNVGCAFLEAGKTVTFALSSTTLTTLKIGTITWPNAYSQTLAKNAYAVNDKAGLYVVADDNTTIRYQNIPVTYDGTTWQINHSTTAGVVYHRPGYHYYLYYPYTATPDQDYPVTGQGAGQSTSDEAFFSTLITGWGREVNAPIDDDTDRRDQSQTADFTAADLHIAELTAEGGGNGYVSTVGATMKHAMGLAVFTLDKKTLDKRKTYTLSTDAAYQFYVKTGTQEVTASGDFNGKTYIPYKLDNTTYLYWVKPGQTTSVSTAAGADSWSESVNVALNQCVARTEEPTGPYYNDGSETYTLAVGDVYFTDGSLGKSGSAYPQDSKTPAGIVYALSGDMSTADKTNGFTHGYVFSLKDANAQGAGHQWTTLSGNDVSGIANVTWEPTTDMSVTEGVIKDINGSGQNGYSNTQAVNALNALSDYPAFQAVGVYNTTSCPISASAPNNSGWYLPSIAEWWLVCKNLGSMNTGYRSNDTGWHDDSNSLWGVYYYNNSANSVHAALNTALSKAGSKGTVYNPIQGGSAADPDADMSAASVVYYWSSSEWSGAGYAFSVDFYASGYLVFVRYRDKSDAFRVRPVLAF